MSQSVTMIRTKDELIIETSMAPADIIQITASTNGPSGNLTATPVGNKIHIELKGSGLLHREDETLCNKQDISTIKVAGTYTTAALQTPGTFDISFAGLSTVSNSKLVKLKGADEFITSDIIYSALQVTFAPASNSVSGAVDATHTFTAKFKPKPSKVKQLFA